MNRGAALRGEAASLQHPSAKHDGSVRCCEGPRARGASAAAADLQAALAHGRGAGVVVAARQC